MNSGCSRPPVFCLGGFTAQRLPRCQLGLDALTLGFIKKKLNQYTLDRLFTKRSCGGLYSNRRRQIRITAANFAIESHCWRPYFNNQVCAMNGLARMINIEY